MTLYFTLDSCLAIIALCLVVFHNDFFSIHLSNSSSHISVENLTQIASESGPKHNESLFDLAKYGFWSGEVTPGVRRPVNIRTYVFVLPETLQPRDPHFVRKKEDSRC